MDSLRFLKSNSRKSEKLKLGTCASGFSKKLLMMTLLVLFFTIQFVNSEETRKEAPLNEIYHEEISLKKDNKSVVSIATNTIFSKRPGLDTNKNLIVLQVQNTIISKGSSNLNHLIDVRAQVVKGTEEEDPVDIKDVIVNNEEGDVILHYIIYDLCNLDDNSKINLEIIALDGEFQGFVSAEIIDLSPFSIQCIAKESETFLPREQHGACETWDGTVWVFGGKRNVEKEEEVLNDIMSFDSKLRQWRTVTPSTKAEPTPRFGHITLCYFNYIIIFGGQSDTGKILGDLWVFDIIREQWKFIIDTADTHEMSRLGIDGFVPTPRMFAASVMSIDMGAAFIMGGMTESGVACDIWGLRIEQILSYVEDSSKNPISNYWILKEVDQSQVPYLCRSGHAAAWIDAKNFLLYGGIDDKRKFVTQSVKYHVITNNVGILNAKGDIPDERLRAGFLSTGNGMIIMYGGMHLQGKGYFTDLWHFTVKSNNIIHKRVQYPREDTNLFMTWRHGFTMHYVRNIADPILIGGTYGNNQQSKVLITLPEKKCTSEAEFAEGECSPCPRGSVLKGDKCKWCGHSQYFDEHFNDYFNSECIDCPQGLVGGNYRSCVPCEGGFIYDMTDHSFCKQCSQDKICPVGTKFEFPTKEFSENFEEIRMDNLPDFFNPHATPFDHTGTIVIFLCVTLTLILFILIAMILSICKEKALFVFRELDKTFITGGGTKNVVGGIIVCFFILVTVIVSGGFIINYLVYNSKTVASETQNPFMNKSLPSSYLFNVTIYTSRFIESEEPFEMTMNNFQKLEHKPLPNLCKKQRIMYFTSRYFAQVRDGHTNFSCERKQLSNGTDAYSISLLIRHIDDEAPKNAYVRFLVDSPYDQLVHFFKWEYWNIWRFYEHIPISYSKISGFVTPQMTARSNKNITAGFKGPDSTKIFFKLTPTHYGNEMDSLNFEGYQVFVEEYQRGSVVNKRNMINENLATGERSAGFDLELVSSVGDTLYHIEVQRVKSIIEIIAYIFGFTAGFIIVSHILKHFLSKEEYFKGLDREWNTLFGSMASSRVDAYSQPRNEATSETEFRRDDESPQLRHRTTTKTEESKELE